MSKVIIVIVIVVVLGLAGWMILGKGGTSNIPFYPQNNQSSPAPEGQNPEEAQVVGTDVPLNSQNNSNILGDAIIKEVNGKAVVTVNVKGGTEGSSQTTSINMGTCDNLGSVKYQLNPVTSGTSETTLSVSLADLKGMGVSAISVQNAATKSGSVACGDIKL